MNKRAKPARNATNDTGTGLLDVSQSQSAHMFSNSNALMFSPVRTISREDLARLPKLHRQFAEKVLIKENKLRVV